MDLINSGVYMKVRYEMKSYIGCVGIWTGRGIMRHALKRCWKTHTEAKFYISRFISKWNRLHA